MLAHLPVVIKQLWSSHEIYDSMQKLSEGKKGAQPWRGTHNAQHDVPQ